MSYKISRIPKEDDGWIHITFEEQEAYENISRKSLNETNKHCNKVSIVCGILMILFKCRGLVGDIDREYELKYEIVSCKWMLWKIIFYREEIKKVM